MRGLTDSWNNWSEDDAVNGVYSATTALGVMGIQVAVNQDVNACFYPNAADVVVNIDFTSKWLSVGTKVVLQVRYEMFEETVEGEVTTRTHFGGDQSARILSQFGAIAGATTSSGPVSVAVTVASIGSATKPQYDVYYTFDTTDHAAVFQNIHFTTSGLLPIQ